ncbi:hypothetical protein ACQEU5_07900 [Marinactinospora thermotolerans]|uniref:Uncharacterized protein n=1 Tax=Marinactinospora thermotolerans DSM 45154 TaxID=1122192 RepID=A0A1T4R8J3_9ACTN|nr:hypothetical protein [Marinactinospora thermotolerans]SKA11931.1 hypothetical protein SAMN02745673_02587 [Marinactinospora thermotolerans DSM 45154]
MSDRLDPLVFDDLVELREWARAMDRPLELVERAPDSDVYAVRAGHATAVCHVPICPDEATLRRLNAEHTGRWRVWRSLDEHGRPAAWVATNLGAAGAAMTLHETTPERLEEQMNAPPPAYGRALGTPSHEAG